MTDITTKIFETIKERGISQKEFARQTGISEASISDWKRKGTNPSAGKIMDICRCLAISPEELFGESVLVDDYTVLYGDEERELIEIFRQLDSKQKIRVRGYMDALLGK